MPKKSAAPGAAYTVGYGRPPIKNRFRRGQSGNPRGRPRKSAPAAEVPPGLDPLLSATLRIMSEEVEVCVDGQRRSMRGEEAMLRALLDRVLLGDMRPARLLLDLRAEAQARAKQIEAQSVGDSISRAVVAVAHAMRTAKSLGHEDIDAFLDEVTRSALASAAANGCPAEFPSFASKADPADMEEVVVAASPSIARPTLFLDTSGSAQNRQRSSKATLTQALQNS